MAARQARALKRFQHGNLCKTRIVILVFFFLEFSLKTVLVSCLGAFFLTSPNNAQNNISLYPREMGINTI